MAVTPNLERAAGALDLNTDLGQAGAVFNDATRLLDGGLWNKPADINNQLNSQAMFAADIHALISDVTSAATLNGAALTTADTTFLNNTIAPQLNTMLADAAAATGHGAAATAAQLDLQTLDASIIQEVNAHFPTLTAATYFNGKTGANDAPFQTLPMGADNTAALATAHAGANLADIGAVFNAAANLAVGGLNKSNLGQFTTDMQAVADGLNNLLNNPTALAAATGDSAASTIHIQTLLDQANLQLNKFDGLYHSNPSIAARSTNDNLLDMIDIVQGDPNLAANAGSGAGTSHTGGFAEMPGPLAGTIQHYQDNQAQTNFWSAFIAEGNLMNADLNTVAAGGTPTTGSIANLITEIHNYEQFTSHFDASQGGIFGARFDNELLVLKNGGGGGTVLADSTAAIQGLTGIVNGDTGAALAADQAQIIAAGAGFVANAADVSGNNTPVGGGSYVATATTIAGATSPAGVATGPTLPVTPESLTGGMHGALADAGAGSTDIPALTYHHHLGHIWG